MTLPEMSFPEVQSAMHERGTTPSRWAVANGYHPSVVMRVIHKEIKGPKSSEIARKLQAFLNTPIPDLKAQ